MSLEDDIVIVNEFTSKFNDSRGNSLNKYIMSYCNRPDAIQSLLPFNKSEDAVSDFEGNQQLMEQFLGKADQQAMNYQQGDNLEDLSSQLWNRQGVAFDQTGISINHDQLLNEANEVQSLFEQDHVILKTVISFRLSYLKDMNIFNSEQEVSTYGDPFSNADDVKLRAGLNQGLHEYTEKGLFSDPMWVGAIQFDTEQVHAHLVIADRGSLSSSRRVINYLGQPQERGKINKREANVMRENIDEVFAMLKPMRRYTKTVEPVKNLVETKEFSSDLVKTNNRDNLQILFMTNRLLQQDEGRNLFDEDVVNDVYDEDHQRYVNGLLNDYAKQLNLPVEDARGVLRRDIEQLTAQFGGKSAGDASMNWALKQRYLDPKIVTRPNILSIADDRLNRAGQINQYRNHRLDNYLRNANEFAGYTMNYADRRLLNQTTVDSQIMDIFYQNELLYNGQLVNKYMYFNSFDQSNLYQKQKNTFTLRRENLLEERDRLFDDLVRNDLIGDSSGYARSMMNSQKLMNQLDKWGEENHRSVDADTAKEELDEVGQQIIPAVGNRSLRVILSVIPKQSRKTVRQNLERGQAIDVDAFPEHLQRRLQRYQRRLNEYHLDLFNLGAISAERLVYDFQANQGQRLASPDEGNDPLVVLNETGFNRHKGLDLTTEMDEPLVKSLDLSLNDLNENDVSVFRQAYRGRRQRTDLAEQYLTGTNQQFEPVERVNSELQNQLRVLERLGDEELRRRDQQRLQLNGDEEQRQVAQVQRVEQVTSEGLSDRSLNQTVEGHLHSLRSTIDSDLGR